MLYIPDVCIRVLWTSDRHGRTNLSLKDLRYDTNSIIYAQNNPEYGVTNIRGPGIRTRLDTMLAERFVVFGMRRESPSPDLA